MKHFLALLLCCSAFAQDLRLPDASPWAYVAQEVGISKIKIEYHSPSVNGREVWGKLVPYGFEKNNPFGNGKPMPWRAGANENTTFTLTHDALVEGKELKKGTYGLHMVPGKDEWTIIFSNNSTSWGSFFYEESEDALRINVKPIMVNDMQERLTYGFDNTNMKQTTVFLRWEKLKVPFNITFDTPAIVYDYMKKRTRDREAFDGPSLLQAAQYCVRNNLDLNQAIYWVDRAVQMGQGASAQFLKATIQEKQGKTADAESTKKAAIERATENELNTYGYQLLGQSKAKEALEIFKTNAKKYPDSWNVYDSLGDGYKAAGDKKAAIDSFTKAQKMVKDDANKKRIGDILKELNETK